MRGSRVRVTQAAPSNLTRRWRVRFDAKGRHHRPTTAGSPAHLIPARQRLERTRVRRKHRLLRKAIERAKKNHKRPRARQRYWRAYFPAGFSAVTAICPSAASSLGSGVVPAGNWLTERIYASASAVSALLRLPGSFAGMVV